MIARPLPFEDDAPARVGTRSGRTAALRRRVRTKRRRYAAINRVVAVVAGLTLCIVVYLALLANVTRMDYELTKSTHEKSRLQEVSARLEDRIARLESREHLAQLASKLGMHDAQTFAAIVLPAERPPEPARLAFLRWLK